MSLSPEVRVDSFGGAIVDVNPLDVPLGFAAVARNVYSPVSGSLAKRPGFTRHAHIQYTGAVSALASVDDVTLVIGGSICDV